VEGGSRCSALRRVCREGWRDGAGDGHENTMGWRWTAWRLDEGSYADGLGLSGGHAMNLSV
jgi:hypothetical protein